MEPSIIRRLLHGYEPSSDKIAEEDRRVRDEISAKECGKCGSPLQPRVPPANKPVFRETRVLYVAWCPTCNCVSG